jgi:hypothetical protein
MKFILICLSFYLVFYFLSALDPFNIQGHQHDDDLDPSHLQELEYDQEVNPKFRPWFEIHRKNRTEISPILQDNMPLIELHQVDEHTTKSSSLLQILTSKSQHPSFAGNFFQRQLRAFFGYQQEKFPSPTRSYIKTGLR